MSGICYLVATPIGNLKDVTLRALEFFNIYTFIGMSKSSFSKSFFAYSIGGSMTDQARRLYQ